MRIVAVLAFVVLASGCLHVQSDALEPGKGGILGQIVVTQDSEDRQNGPPQGIPDANILVYDVRHAFVAETTSDENGSFTVKNLAPGDYYVKGGGGDYDANDTPSPNATVVEGKYTRIKLEADRID